MRAFERFLNYIRYDTASDAASPTCPNLATGGMNCHGRFECVAVEDMDLMIDVLVKLVTE